MRCSIKKSGIISILATSLCMALLAVTNQAFAADNARHQDKTLNNKSNHSLQIAKGQRYMPLDKIYRKQC